MLMWPIRRHYREHGCFTITNSSLLHQSYIHSIVFKYTHKLSAQVSGKEITKSKDVSQYPAAHGLHIVFYLYTFILLPLSYTQFTSVVCQCWFYLHALESFAVKKFDQSYIHSTAHCTNTPRSSLTCYMIQDTNNGMLM